MRAIKFIYRKNSQSGFALVLTLTVILVLSFAIGAFIKSSLRSKAFSTIESKSKLNQVTAYSNFAVVKSALLAAVNSGIQNYNPLLGGTAALTNAVYQPLTGANAPNYQITCSLNCNFTKTYPKTFIVRVLEYGDAGSKGHVTEINGTIEIAPVSLANYSSLVTAETAPTLTMSSGTYAKLGIFWDQSKKPIDPNAPWGVLHFVNPVGTNVSIEKLITNTTYNNIQFGTLANYAVNYGDNGGVITGGVTIAQGVLSSTSPSQELTQDFNSLAQSNGVIASGKTGVDHANLKMSCPNGNCIVELTEYDINGTATAVYPAGAMAQGSVLYTKAPVVNVMPYTVGDKSAVYGAGNFTVIADGYFALKSSVTMQNPTADINTQGNLALATLGTSVPPPPAAVVMDSNTVTQQGNTLGQIVNKTATAPAATTTSINYQAGAISVGTGIPAMALTPDILTNVPTGSKFQFGSLQTDGPLWGATSIYTRTTDSNGNVVTGFSNFNTGYSSRWLQSPPPGVNVKTSSDHTATVTGLSVRYHSLSKALKDLGLTWQTPPALTSTNIVQ